MTPEGYILDVLTRDLDSEEGAIEYLEAVYSG